MSHPLLDRSHGRRTDADTFAPSPPDITLPTGSDTCSEINPLFTPTLGRKSHNAVLDRWFTGGIWVLMLASGLSAAALFGWMCRP